MSIAAGTRLGPYEVASLIGEGGMGQVYKARDTRLDRTVAVKVLPTELSADADRRARFAREARAIASLSHPHICALYDVGEAVPSGPESRASSSAREPALSEPRERRVEGQTLASVHYLVMEYLEGETLAQRLARAGTRSRPSGPPTPPASKPSGASPAVRASAGAPLPLDETLRIGTELAEALAAAHRAGIVHRDLKPGNVMLTPSGAKVLDFGLARLHKTEAAPDASSLATCATDPLTDVGTRVGTVPYMAPEQVEGKEADARSDVFALGAVLYEMASGRRAFEGDTAASVAAAILERQPPLLSTWQPLTPPALEHVVSTCLTKDPEARWQAASDVARELRWIGDEERLGRTPSGGAPAEAAAAAARAATKRLRRWRIASAAGALVAMLAGAGVVWLWSGKAQPSASSPPVVRSLIGVAPAEDIYGGGLFPIVIPTPGGARTAMTWAPDGQALVFVGRVGQTPRLYVRRLDESEPRVLEGTDYAQLPAVSPDGKWVAYYERSTRIIKKVPFGGGAAVDVSSERVVYPPSGMAWDDNGALYYDNQLERGIWVIPPGDKARSVTTPRFNAMKHANPWPLPGGRALIYTNRKRSFTWGDEEIVVQPLPAGEPKVLVADGADARYLPAGYLVFMRRGVLFAAPFDVERLELRGTPVPVLDGVLQSLWAGNPYDATGIGQFAMSAGGHLAFLRGPLVPVPPNELVSIDKSGRVTVLPAPQNSYGGPRVSPDGQRLVVVAGDLTDQGAWVYDLARGTIQAVNREGESTNAVWALDGERLLFQWNDHGRSSLVAQAADGTGQPQVLLADSDFFPAEVRPDGKAVAGFTLAGGQSKTQLVTLSGDTAQAAPFPQMAGGTQWPAFSPDGRWLAYGSGASNRLEVYVQAYPGPGTRVPVSIEGGQSPTWHPNGREIYFLNFTAANQISMMAVDFTPGSPPRVGRPRRLFTYDAQKLMLMCVWSRCYDVSADGERFYGVQETVSPNPAPVTHIHLVMNWLEELKAKVPAVR